MRAFLTTGTRALVNYSKRYWSVAIFPGAYNYGETCQPVATPSLHFFIVGKPSLQPRNSDQQKASLASKIRRENNKSHHLAIKSNTTRTPLRSTSALSPPRLTTLPVYVRHSHTHPTKVATSLQM